MQWYIIEQFKELQLKSWFMPDVNVQREGDKNLANAPFYADNDHIIQQGDWKLNVNTAYAIEGNIKHQLSEWDNEWIQIKLEQTAVFNGSKVCYLAGRQTEWHLIR